MVVEIFIFYFINLNIVNFSSILLMSISYIHSLLIIETTLQEVEVEVEVEIGSV